MLFFQSIHCKALDILMNIISFSGEVAVPLLAIMIIYWCIDKRKAFIITGTMTTALISAQIIKAIVRSPRPFQVYPDLIKGDRISTATGYSFPSGHSTQGASFYSSLWFCFRSPSMLALSAFLIIMIPVSRLYLGVHWPADVLAGTAIGLSAGLLLSPVFGRIAGDRSTYQRFTLIYGAIAMIAAIITTVLLDAGLVDATAFSDAMSALAIIASSMTGFFLESRYVSFSVPASLRKKAISFLAGAAMAAAAAAAIMLIPLPHYAEKLVLFLFAGFWVSFLYPALAVRMKLMDQSL